MTTERIFFSLAIILCALVLGFYFIAAVKSMQKRADLLFDKMQVENEAKVRAITKSIDSLSSLQKDLSLRMEKMRQRNDSLVVDIRAMQSYRSRIEKLLK